MRIKNVGRRRTVIATEENGELDISTARLPLYKELYSMPLRLQVYRFSWWFKFKDKDFGYRPFDLGFFDGDNTIFGYEAFGCTYPALVRPVLEISNINASDLRIQDTFEFGGKKFEIFSDDKAFCLEDIGSWYLGKGYESCQEQEVNNIAVHSVTHYIDEWFKNSKQEK